jgi:2-C-methyl-D-erythritol 2,4-cyclodiphosphate synthase
LEHILDLIDQHNFQIGNIDATLIAERPKLLPYFDEMKQHLCKALKLSASQLNLKATTSESMGFAGRGEGMGCWAIALLIPKLS